MPVHIPVGALSRFLGWAFDRLTQRIMRPTYEWSHEKWEQRERLGSWWYSLGDHVEYTIRVATLVDPESYSSQIAFRSPKAELDQLDLVFDAFGSGVRYQHQISISGLDGRPVVHTLTHVPRDDFLDHIKEGIFFSVESYKITNCRIRLHSGETINVEDSKTMHLDHDWILNGKWVTRWGRTFNCNAIDWAKRDIQLYWKFGFGRPKVIVFSADPSRCTRITAWRRLAIALGQVMGSHWLVTVQFWLAIWSGLYVLNEDERLQRRWRRDGDDEDAS
ncbi:hypothetical protein BLA18110_07968 [Burkholderia lata]|uniref:hypothetical protein n=1 Tax=Burkholderia lata (strain ATCC 17760 / DSM 23089 / LMG 22485 / NCIMB 9086 / R18194 / 383) TaxID=482957 RepID=UPI001452AB19|nr:hypothetical protein [Burkholderia lata]VWD54729.1 hypothetical protein BLA18110_07968 [Burkholderia lata]